MHQQFINHGASRQALLDHRDRLGDLQHNPDCVSPAQQAANLSTLFANLHGSWSTWVQAAFLYHFTDGSSPTSNIQDAYGLTTNTGDPKPALAIFQTQAALSANNPPRTTPPPARCVLPSAPGGRRPRATWST